MTNFELSESLRVSLRYSLHIKSVDRFDPGQSSATKDMCISGEPIFLAEADYSPDVAFHNGWRPPETDLLVGMTSWTPLSRQLPGGIGSVLISSHRNWIDQEISRQVSPPVICSSHGIVSIEGCCNKYFSIPI